MNENLELGLKRTAEMCAIFMIGNGLIGLLQGDRQTALWRSDIKAIDRLVARPDGKPKPKKRDGLIQIAAGLLLASQLKPPAKRSD